jgi:hypothetical protein
MARAEITLKTSQLDLEKIPILLKNGRPSIFTFVDRGHLFINPMTLFEGETEIIIKQLMKIENELK